MITLGFSVASAAIAGSVDVIELRNALPAFAAGSPGMAWVYFRAESMRGLVWALTIGLSVLALPLGLVADAVVPPPEPRAGVHPRRLHRTRTRRGRARAAASRSASPRSRRWPSYIDEQDIADNQILTDNARTFGVIALTGQPELFFDRVDKGDDEWQAVLANPDGQGRLHARPEDRRRPDPRRATRARTDGTVPGLTPVVSNDRYALLQVNGSTSDSSGADEPALDDPRRPP